MGELVEGKFQRVKYPFSRYITVRTSFRGSHSYPNAPEEVAFLKNNHRHTFYVTAEISVGHYDRELEFFTVQDLMDKQIIVYMGLGELGSCEMMAHYIATGLINVYGDHRYYKVTVSEDGENDGAVVFDRVKYARDKLLYVSADEIDYRHEVVHGKST